jgi:hypothetical protein
MCAHIMLLLLLLPASLTTAVTAQAPLPGHCGGHLESVCSVNVLDFGADNFQHNKSNELAFNAAVQHLQSLGAPQGGMGSVMGAFYAPTIYVPTGMYLISDQINFSNSPLQGEPGNYYNMPTSFLLDLFSSSRVSISAYRHCDHQAAGRQQVHTCEPRRLALDLAVVIARGRAASHLARQQRRRRYCCDH